ncbi:MULTISPECIES: hydroxyacid dehydrogenase [unclassified Rhizobium]|uniref:hydroxyacid dehydrogenase n=1 Tax=unclassified Rhizobium TaxID=2613769 RepID=UPI001044CD58|nr:MULTISPECIES: hydroxyacid dehydrogenase [unclassified Rhizobium]MBB3397029.1 D-3-phosphoglycerate dehydrogenase [Rhizobium sp. BK060]MBB4170744.1 D-3-phosphoglycerate dehydrogenase [Rhizobium sp. BK538]TCM75985.1 D-3-phosphoglycerate dehydrogenase [Rhizobium sp. BK068]
MPHLLAAGKLHPSGEALLSDLKTRGFSVDYIEEVSEPSYAPLIAKADALVIRTQPLSVATIAQAERLKVVSRHGVGYDSVDLPALNRRGIALTIVGDVNSVSVAEHAMMQLLAGAKRVLLADRAVREPGQWGWRNRLEQQEISGKNLLIIGYGRIGRHLARMASGFGMQIRAYDPFLEKAGWPDGMVRPVPLDEGMAWADCISVHIPKADKPAIGAAEIARMKRGVVLVNTARGGVVSEQALADALASGQVGAAGVDVFDDEPPVNGSPLFAHPNAILSPHIAGLTAECGERMAIAAIENAVNFLAGTIDPQLVVNPDFARV